MKRIILVGALALLAACGDTKVETASGNTTSKAPTSAAETTAVNTEDTASGATNNAPTGDTITVDNIGDIPPACIELVGDFLKTIEPDVSKIDWATATANQLTAVSSLFEEASQAMDAKMTASGCDKYNLNVTDEQSAAELIKIAEDQAPGTVGFLKFIQTMSTATTAPAGPAASCPEAIAEIETYMAAGGKLKDLPIADLTKVSTAMSAVSTECSPEEAQAFMGRDDVAAFLGS
jgi:hypothetical protein